ncbi:MAG: SMC-Scp complex subunit ScpB [Planctomycetes bacterium]|nr:SMC-Scp complex subunit ScpB [Planctomycetota bacterium]
MDGDEQSLGLNAFGKVRDLGVSLDDPNQDLQVGQEGSESEPDQSCQVSDRVPENGQENAIPDTQSSMDKEETPITEAVLEALLFVGKQRLIPEEMEDLFEEVNAEDIHEIIAELSEMYYRQNRPYAIVSEGRGYQLQLRSDFDFIAQRIYQRNPEHKLNQASIEVLSLVAYRQPITREEIDSYRGADSAAMLRQLLRRELVRLVRQGPPDREIHYHTTERFLELFGLSSPEELPVAEDLLRL